MLLKVLLGKTYLCKKLKPSKNAFLYNRISSKSIWNNVQNAEEKLLNQIVRQTAKDDCHETLPSLNQSLSYHLELFKNKKESKYYLTNDERTRKIVKEILYSEDKDKCTKDFFKKIISEKASHEEKTEMGSIQVLISNIDDYPSIRELYNKEKENGDALICIGGPACEDQALMAKVIPSISKKLSNISYITKDYWESNVNHSAKQSHARHGNALNADRNLTGHRLILKFLRRLVFGDSIDEVLKPDYRKIDLKFDFWNLRKFNVYFGNELNWIVQEFNKLFYGLNEHDKNRQESSLSQDIMHFIEKDTKMRISRNYTQFEKQSFTSFHDNKALGDKVAQDNNLSSSILVVFTEENDKETMHEHEDYDRVNIKWKRLNDDDLKMFFKRGWKNIYRSYLYYDDTSLKFNTHLINKYEAIKRGVNWIEDDPVTNIFVKMEKDKNMPIVCGVLTKSGRYVYANKLHMSGGYKVKYKYDPMSMSRFKNKSFIRNTLNEMYDKIDMENPIENIRTVATGVSVNAVFYRSKYLNELISKYGTTGEIAITNSHWTLIDMSDKYILMRMTGGGNTGSEMYKPAYFLNLCSSTKQIFGDDFIGIYSAYGCSRSINAKNSTEYTIFAKDGLITFGKGGTGNTKRHLEAAYALMDVGFKNEVVNYFNQFTSLGTQIMNMKQISEKSFYSNNIKRTIERMGF